MTQSPEPVDTFELLRARPDDPPNIRMLRIAVMVMSGVLLIGLAAVVARIVYLATRQPVLSASSPPASFPSAAGALTTNLATNLVTDLAVALPPGSKVRSQSLSGNRLAVHYEGAGGEGILIVDLESGRPVSHVHLNAAK